MKIIQEIGEDNFFFVGYHWRIFASKIELHLICDS